MAVSEDDGSCTYGYFVGGRHTATEVAQVVTSSFGFFTLCNPALHLIPHEKKIPSPDSTCNAARTRPAMGWLQFWQKLYSLETLDTRFVIPSNTPPGVTAVGFELNPTRLGLPEQQNAVASLSGPPRSGPVSGARPPLWNTAEFYVYYFLFVTIVPLMCYVPYTVSKRMSGRPVDASFVDVALASHPNYSTYSHLLSDGWIPGRKVVC
jgi:hypothetical protein